MHIVMIAGCGASEEDKQMWNEELSAFAKTHDDIVELKFVENVIEVGFYLNEVDIAFIGTSLENYEENLRAMADHKPIVSMRMDTFHKRDVKKLWELIQEHTVV